MRIDKNEVLSIAFLTFIVFDLCYLENLNTMNDSQAPMIYGIDVSEQDDRTMVVFNTNKPYEIGGRYCTVSGVILEVVACSGPGKNGMYQVGAEYKRKYNIHDDRHRDYDERRSRLNQFAADLLLSKHERE